ncbi:11816_t:CDS:2 [Acaulospora morrowiae]|uniref:11816_t:CDS:1 n=1 Tax=Acaulospora morrowiae TaxID=94023 RepID=A0A9N9GR31_9GLOM|nr:11816_t:CDS:2 [Acaulospora morrowiae]
MSKNSLTSDPKRPNNIVPYHLPRKDVDEVDLDFFGVVSLLFSTVGLIIKIKWACWVALAFSIISITNEKVTDLDANSNKTSSFTSILFAVSGLLINYMYLIIGIPDPAKKD